MSDADRIPAIEALPHGGENLDIMAEAENYNEYLRDLIRRYAGKVESAVDFGAGIGTFSDCLDLAPEHVHCVETKASSRQVIVAKGFNAYENVAQLQQGAIPFVFTLNVLEHIEDDAAALGDLYRLLAPGGRLFIYVSGDSSQVAQFEMSPDTGALPGVGMTNGGSRPRFMAPYKA